MDAKRKGIELRAKAASLRRELDYWRGLAAAGEPMEKHQSQIESICRLLQASIDAAYERIDAAERTDDALTEWSAQLEQIILELHRIWGFFRAKLTLRHAEWYRTYLTIADEFAWNCYRPARDAAVEDGLIELRDVKAPPLVFFSGSASPYAMSRHVAFHSEIPHENGVGFREFKALLQSLPIPVVGVPWYQIDHLPDLVVVGHEVGHTVEDDLHLTDLLHEELDHRLNRRQVPSERREAWHAWLGEIFADVYGTLATGAAYVGGQADFLCTSAASIAEEEPPRGYGSYPTVYVRMLLAFEVLRQMGLTAEAQDRRESWLNEHPVHHLQPFEADIELVVAGVLEREYVGERTLPEIVRLRPYDAQQAEEDADRVLTRRAPNSSDVRTLVAAARLAFERDPETYRTIDADGRFKQALLALVEEGPRGRERGEVSRFDALDKTAGAVLCERLASMHEPSRVQSEHSVSFQ